MVWVTAPHTLPPAASLDWLWRQIVERATNVAYTWPLLEAAFGARIWRCTTIRRRTGSIFQAASGPMLSVLFWSIRGIPPVTRFMLARVSPMLAATAKLVSAFTKQLMAAITGPLFPT